MEPLAQLHHDVVFGKAGGRIIWQPRIGCWYYDKEFAGEPLPEPYRGLDLMDIYRSLGCSARLYRAYNPCLRAVDPDAVTRTTEQLNATDVKTTLTTPAGKQVRIDRKSPNNPHIIHVRWPVESEDDLKIQTWIAEHRTWAWDRACFEQAQREVGDLGAPTIFLPRSNVQDLYINLMGIERGIYAIYDWPGTVERYFRVLDECHDRLIDVVNAAPVDIINLGENIHSGTLSPDLFKRYHLPGCRRRCERLHQAGKFVSSHWDGDCGPLLPYAKDTGLDAIEAITPKPQGDVTFDQMKDGLGDDLYLLDGIPAVYFDKTFSVETLVESVHALIDRFAPKLVLGISDELSSTGDIERIRIVGEIVDAYNASR
ncbi:MAG: hypothetical protein JW951_04735 [Lentisphaerae bacterium]|nr:hypothetical protein [Lentisphaerota bacterium]